MSSSLGRSVSRPLDFSVSGFLGLSVSLSLLVYRSRLSVSRSLDLSISRSFSLLVPLPLGLSVSRSLDFLILGVWVSRSLGLFDLSVSRFLLLIVFICENKQENVTTTGDVK